MSLFARSKHGLETVAVEFLPFEQQLHLVVADADMNLQMLQFDPDSMFPGWVVEVSLPPLPSPSFSHLFPSLTNHKH
jgi:hypothetical protein